MNQESNQFAEKVKKHLSLTEGSEIADVNLEKEEINSWQLQQESWENYHELGDVLQNNGKFQEAVEAYYQALNLNSKSFWSYYNLGNALLKLEKWSEAIEAYESAIALDPKFSWSYYNLGEALSKLEKWSEAAIAYRYAIELKPEFFGSYHNLGDALSKLEKWSEAVVAYRGAIELNSELSWSHHNLGMALFKLEKYSEAVGAYNQAIELNSESSWYYQNLGEALTKQEKWSEATVAYQRAVELDPETVWLHQILGELLQKQGQLSEAIAVYKWAIELHSTCYWLYVGLGQMLMQQQQWEEAIATFIKALQIKPDCHEAYNSVAEILEKKGQLEEASWCYLGRSIPLNLVEEFCQLKGDWEVTSETDNNITHINIYSEVKIRSLPSQTIQYNRSFPNFQEDLTTRLTAVEPDGSIKWNTEKNIISPKAFVAIVPEGRAWGDSLTTAVITSDNKLVGDISAKGNAELVLSSQQLPDPEYVDGTVVFLSVKWGEYGYFHWMFDIISRFELLECCGITINKIDKIIINTYSRSYEKETLTTLGIPATKIIQSRSCPHIKAKNLVVPSLPYHGAYKTAPWASQFLKRQFLQNQNNQNITQGKRIYLSRKAPFSRRIINEEAVLSILKQFGFCQVTLESMSVAEQAACLGNAEIVVSPHGAGLTNLVFCKSGTKVIEIFSPWYVPSDYWLLSNGCNLEHYSLIGEIFDDGYSEHIGCKNIMVNLEELEQLLNLAGVTNGKRSSKTKVRGVD